MTSREGQDENRITPAGSGPSLILSAGTVIGGKFRIQKRIARGGQASVYLAHQEPLNRPVALKLLSPPNSEATAEERDAFEQRFLLEARTLAGLDHPNIVTVFDYGETDDGRYYLAMEYISGGRFLDLLKKGRLNAGRAVGLVIQVAQALRYAHKRGVVHRDVKNSNVLVRTLDNGEEQAKVVDFGLVKLSRMDTGLTQTGMILGSPHFMAPEQATGQAVDHRADIYATGVLLYCGLTAKYPFDGPHATAIITAHVTRDVPSFASKAPEAHIPEGLETVVRRCLEKKPGRRYPSMDALIADLMPYQTGPGSEAVSGEFNTLTAGKPVEIPRVWNKKTAWSVLALGVAVVLAAMLALAIGLFTIQGDRIGEVPTTDAPVTKPPAVIELQPAPEPEPVQAEPVQSDPVEAQPPPPSRVKRRVSRPEPVQVQPEPTPAIEPEAQEKSEDDWADIDLEQMEDPWSD